MNDSGRADGRARAGRLLVQGSEGRIKPATVVASAGVVDTPSLRALSFSGHERRPSAHLGRNLFWGPGRRRQRCLRSAARLSADQAQKPRWPVRHTTPQHLDCRGAVTSNSIGAETAAPGAPALARPAPRTMPGGQSRGPEVAARNRTRRHRLRSLALVPALLVRSVALELPVLVLALPILRLALLDSLLLLSLRRPLAAAHSLAHSRRGCRSAASVPAVALSRRMRVFAADSSADGTDPFRGRPGRRRRRLKLSKSSS